MNHHSALQGASSSCFRPRSLNVMSLMGFARFKNGKIAIAIIRFDAILMMDYFLW
jgi:hypothetical protein